MLKSEEAKLLNSNKFYQCQRLRNKKIILFVLIVYTCNWVITFCNQSKAFDCVAHDFKNLLFCNFTPNSHHISGTGFKFWVLGCLRRVMIRVPQAQYCVLIIFASNSHIYRIKNIFWSKSISKFKRIVSGLPLMMVAVSESVFLTKKFPICLYMYLKPYLHSSMNFLSKYLFLFVRYSFTQLIGAIPSK